MPQHALFFMGLASASDSESESGWSESAPVWCSKLKPVATPTGIGTASVSASGETQLEAACTTSIAGMPVVQLGVKLEEIPALLPVPRWHRVARWIAARYTPMSQANRAAAMQSMRPRSDMVVI